MRFKPLVAINPNVCRNLREKVDNTIRSSYESALFPS